MTCVDRSVHLEAVHRITFILISCQQEYFTSFSIIHHDCLSLDVCCLHCVLKMNIPNPGALSDQTLAKGLCVCVFIISAAEGCDGPRVGLFSGDQCSTAGID